MLDYIVDRLDVDQYGRLRGISTTHTLVDMAHTLLLTAEERKASHVIPLDYSKASDHVDHTVLISRQMQKLQPPQFYHSMVSIR